MKSWLSSALLLATLTACGSPPPAPPPSEPSPPAAGGPPPAVQVTAEERQRAVLAELAGEYQQVTMHVTAAGFEPRVLRVRTGIPTKLVVIRDVEETCATDFQMPAQGVVDQRLALDAVTVVEFIAFGAGEYPFGCGADMRVSGLLVVEGETIRTPGGPAAGPGAAGPAVGGPPVSPPPGP